MDGNSIDVNGALGNLAVVYVQLGITTWLVRRYRAYVVELREEAERPKRRLKAIGERSSDGARREGAGRWWGKRASGSR